MSVFNVLNAGLMTKLGGDATLVNLLGGTAIYYLHAPDDADLPYVVWNYQAFGDENLSANRTKNGLVFVRGYNQTGPALAGTIDARIDSLLHLKPLTVTGWSNFWIAREQDLSNIEIDSANVKTWMAGGMYRVRLDSN